MVRKVLLPRRKHPKQRTRDRKKSLLKLVENDFISRVSYQEYRDKVRDVYGGPQGALLSTASLLSLHIHLGDRLLRERKFDLRAPRAFWTSAAAPDKSPSTCCAIPTGMHASLAAICRPRCCGARATG